MEKTVGRLRQVFLSIIVLFLCFSIYADENYSPSAVTVVAGQIAPDEPPTGYNPMDGFKKKNNIEIEADLDGDGIMELLPRFVTLKIPYYIFIKNGGKYQKLVSLQKVKFVQPVADEGSQKIIVFGAGPQKTIVLYENIQRVSCLGKSGHPYTAGNIYMIFKYGKGRLDLVKKYQSDMVFDDCIPLNYTHDTQPPIGRYERAFVVNNKNDLLLSYDVYENDGISNIIRQDGTMEKADNIAEFHGALVREWKKSHPPSGRTKDARKGEDSRPWR